MMQIKSIILYNNTGEKTRQLNFELECINLITGDSDTGKSALIPIIDYCLGHSEFEIPAGVIRENVSWYAVLYQVGNKQAFIAKPKPKYGDKNFEAYYIENEKIIIPLYTQLNINSSDDDVKDKLSQLLRQSLGLPPLAIEKAEAQKMTIDYTNFYLFQERKVIANNEILFYKQYSESKTIIETLPYFLGAKNEKQFVLQESHEKSLKELRKAKAQWSSQKNQIELNEEKTKHFFIQAQKVELIDRSLLTEHLSIKEMRELLQNICQAWQPTESLPVMDEVEHPLREEIDRIRQDFYQKQHEISRVESYLQTINGYSQEVDEHKMRLESIQLFEQQDSLSQTICPLCNAPLKQKIPAILSIQNTLNQLQKSLDMARRDKIDLEDTTQKLIAEREEIRNNLKEKQNTLSKVLRENQTKKDFLQRLLLEQGSIRELIGRIKEYLELTKYLDNIAELTKKIDFLKKEINTYQQQLDAVKDSTASILDSLAQRITDLAKEIDLSYQGLYRFNLEKLNVTVSQSSGHLIPMKSMGGGLNSLGCHLIILLALHHHFISHKKPVPQFLVLDQPVQGYLSNEFQNYDAEKIDRLINLLLKVCHELNLQIILTEHDRLQQTGLHRVEPHWTSENALIPKDWIL